MRSPSTSPTRVILRPRPRPAAQTRLFCLPHAGAGASAYRAWASLLPESAELCAVQPPGREARWGERLVTDVHRLADQLLDELRPFLDRRCLLFGHSLGALVAFELARRLEQGGGPTPARLFVSGANGPRAYRIDRPLHTLPDAELVAELHSFAGTPPEVLNHAELLELVLPVIRADLEAAWCYRYLGGPPLRTPISVFWARADRFVTPDGVEDWRAATLAPTTIDAFEGDHFYLDPQRESVVRRVLELGLSST